MSCRGHSGVAPLLLALAVLAAACAPRVAGPPPRISPDPEPTEEPCAPPARTVTVRVIDAADQPVHEPTIRVHGVVLPDGTGCSVKVADGTELWFEGGRSLALEVSANGYASQAFVHVVEASDSANLLRVVLAELGPIPGDELEGPCPPCMPTPPGCIGTGPCGCGPWICEDDAPD